MVAAVRSICGPDLHACRIAPGVHRPLVTVRSGREAGETLASFDFDLMVRVDSPRSMLQRVRSVDLNMHESGT